MLPDRRTPADLAAALADVQLHEAEDGEEVALAFIAPCHAQQAVWVSYHAGAVLRLACRHCGTPFLEIALTAPAGP